MRDQKTKLLRIKPGLTQAARSLRKTQTEAEIKLWFHLRNSRLQGIKFRRQVQMLHYVLDFYCAEKKIAIELDGGHHAEDGHASRDQVRDAALRQLGIRTLRFWNDQVLRETDAVLLAVFHAAIGGGLDA